MKLLKGKKSKNAVSIVRQIDPLISAEKHSQFILEMKHVFISLCKRKTQNSFYPAMNRFVFIAEFAPYVSFRAQAVIL